LFRNEAADALQHAAFLTDAIVDLGGEPTTSPKAFDKPRSMRAMLDMDLATEQEDVARYLADACLAATLDEVELEFKLEAFAADQMGHAATLQHLLNRT
jgi:bacterioferritin